MIEKLTEKDVANILAICVLIEANKDLVFFPIFTSYKGQYDLLQDAQNPGCFLSKQSEGFIWSEKSPKSIGGLLDLIRQRRSLQSALDALFKNDKVHGKDFTSSAVWLLNRGCQIQAKRRSITRHNDDIKPQRQIYTLVH